MALATTIATPLPIAAPPVIQAEHGLLATAAQLTAPADNHWKGGFSFEPEICNVTVQAYPALCVDYEADPPKPTKIVMPAGDIVSLQPYPLIASYSCSWGRDFDDMAARALARLQGIEGKALERELWTGERGLGNLALVGREVADPEADLTADDLAIVINPGFDPGANTLADVTAVDLMKGWALLAQHLADCSVGAKGMIHVTSYVAELITAGAGMVDKVGRGAGSVLTTKGRGDLVVVGSGYPGTGPGGAAPGANKVWLYATGPVVYMLGDVGTIGDSVAETMNRRTNEWTVYAERDAAIAYWDGCCHAAVLVDLNAAWLTGGASE